MAIVHENTTYKDQSLTKHGTYSFKPSVNVGGYDVDFVNGPNRDYECPICQFTFRDPVQTRDCGHRFCESCLEPILKKSPSTCPIDRRVLTRDKVYPDKACKRTVLAFKVRCYNFGNDCEWIGELGNLQDHLEQCQLIEVACVNACGRKDIHRNQMSQHTDADGDCPLAIVACRYSDVGCKFKARRNELEDHLRESIEEHLKFAHMRIRELEIRQETICMNGKFLWKITNYDLLMKQSATKKDKEKLCSPPFYTGQYGYKLRAEAFLNGLGQGKGSHLSLYVVIMKGEYDAILPWPFRQNVDFVLIDQDEEVNNRVNKIWKLSCERNSDYFKRPNKSKSLGFGCPKFVSLETLKSRNYIKEQTLFIKIEVEPTDCLVFNPVGFVH
ncbi:TNF receptor-associated factor 4 isoform X2 [Hydra vulgaris]|uniref:TNF receptor-associated factor 4 isoform X2 n=1 Tax=Hydra vulgaris TaxID=6087 RepID=UPI00019274D5|nr:TNF receptor-associated factor 4 isoform X2 [Hydra vulgaris]